MGWLAPASCISKSAAQMSACILSSCNNGKWAQAIVNPLRQAFCIQLQQLGGSDDGTNRCTLKHACWDTDNEGAACEDLKIVDSRPLPLPTAHLGHRHALGGRVHRNNLRGGCRPRFRAAGAQHHQALLGAEGKRDVMCKKLYFPWQRQSANQPSGQPQIKH